jgi:hypothetical protein
MNTVTCDNKNVHIYRFSNKNCYNMYGYFIMIIFLIIIFIIIKLIHGYFI